MRLCSICQEKTTKGFVCWRCKNEQCRYCHTKNNITKDHVIPRSRGGKNNKSNIQPLCEYCNGRKGNMTDKEVGDLMRTIHVTAKTSPAILNTKQGKWYLRIVKGRFDPLNF